MSAPSTVPTEATSQQSSLPYILPFGIFFTLLVISPNLESVLGRWEFPVRALLLAITLFVLSRKVIDLRVAKPLATIAVGIAVFFLWIGPDLLFPTWRNHWLFQNAVMGQLKPGIDPRYQHDYLVLASRAFRAIILVPIIEELFWRAWLLRWLINPNFFQVPMGAFSWSAILISAALFGSEHGSFWDVGFLTGIIYNLWMVKTKRLGDCVLMHAVTNACLSAYVLMFGQWQYWP